MKTRRIGAVLGATALCLTLGACSGGGDDSSDRDPKQRLKSARQTIDEAKSIELSMRTDELPSEAEGVLSAEGVGTHEPAFDGTAQVRALGVTGEVPIVAVGGDVYVKMPFKSDYETLDLDEYAAPDPAQLLSRDDGVTSMITELEDVEAGERELADETEVTPIEGVLPGGTVQRLFPSVDESADFEVTFRLDDDDVLRDATITGPFYPDAEELTYRLSLTASDDTVDITVPS